MVVLRDSWRGFRAGDAFAAIHLGVFAAMLAVIVHGLVDVPYFKNDLSLEFWALVGLTWAGLRRMRGATRAPRQIPLHRYGTGRA